MAEVKRKKFRIQAVVKDIVEIEVIAESLDDALKLSKNVKAERFTKVLGEHIDGMFEVLGVSSEWPDLYD